MDGKNFNNERRKEKFHYEEWNQLIRKSGFLCKMQKRNEYL